MINPMDLSGKHILITGASQGIGKATAIHISRLGAKVALVARNKEKLEDVLSALEGEGHAAHAFDLKQIQDIEGLVKKIVLEAGALNGLVHCAGVATMRPLAMTRTDYLHDMMLTNFYAFIELSRVFSKKQNYVRNASIIGISSVAGSNGLKSKVAYCSSKSAVDGAIRALAVELQDKGIRVNAVIPGFIKTELYDSYIGSTSEEDFERNVLARQVMGLGGTIDVANAVAYLLSEASQFITGTGLVVDGGYLA